MDGVGEVAITYEVFGRKSSTVARGVLVFGSVMFSEAWNIGAGSSAEENERISANLVLFCILFFPLSFFVRNRPTSIFEFNEVE